MFAEWAKSARLEAKQAINNGKSGVEVRKYGSYGEQPIWIAGYAENLHFHRMEVNTGGGGPVVRDNK